MINFTLNQYQDDFVYCPNKFPCLGAGWATGKTLSAIMRSEIYSKHIPDNLGCIFRKTALSLRDSTMQDFQKYTGHKVNSDRNFVYPNGSMVMFRHLDELDSINQQNINLGWFYIEQGDELDSDKEFWMLIGRLRRNVIPSDSFKYFKLPMRSGWVIANAGDHWVKKVFKDNPFKDSKLIEATTFDNKHNLPADFLETLETLRLNSPEIYNRFVLNMWDIATTNRIFPGVLMKHMFERHDILNLARSKNNIGVAVDPSGLGVDDNVFMAGNDGMPMETYKKTIMSATEKALKAVEMCKRHNGWWIIVDCDGIGVETYKELIDLPEDFLQGIQIIAFYGSAPSTMELNGKAMYANKRAEAAFIAQRRGYHGQASVNPLDKMLIQDLEADVAVTKSGGLIQLLPKDDIKKIIKRSPGDGDAWKMFQYACELGIEDRTLSIKPMRQAYAVTNDNLELQQYAHGG